MMMMKRIRCEMAFVSERPAQPLLGPRVRLSPLAQLSGSTSDTGCTAGNHIRSTWGKQICAVQTLPMPPFSLFPSHLLPA